MKWIFGGLLCVAWLVLVAIWVLPDFHLSARHKALVAQENAMLVLLTNIAQNPDDKESRRRYAEIRKEYLEAVKDGYPGTWIGQPSHSPKLRGKEFFPELP